MREPVATRQSTAGWSAAAWLGGMLLATGCVWILVWSPSLTATYTPEFTREYFARMPWLRPAFIDRALDDPSMVGVLEVGLCLMIAGYLLGLLGLARSPNAPSTGAVLGFALLARLTLLMLPGLFSTDIFSYVMAGRISAVYDANPYVHVPMEFASDQFFTWVFPFWRSTPTVYGPLWTDVAWVLSKISGGWANFDQVLLYRLTLAVAELLTFWLVWRLLRSTVRCHRLRAVSLCVFAWNPLWLFDIVGNAHNDVLMVLLLVAGFAAALQGGHGLGTAAKTLSALVKWTTGVALLLDVARARAAHVRCQTLAGAAALVVLLTGVLAGPWFTSPDALAAVSQLGGGRVVMNSVPDVLAHNVYPDAALPVRPIALLIFAAYFAWELRNVSRTKAPDALTVMRATSRALLLIPLLLPTAAWSWYFSWSMPLAAVSGWNAWLTRVVVMYTLFALPLVYLQQYINREVYGLAPIVGALGPAVVCSIWYYLSARRRRRHSTPGRCHPT